MTMIERRKSGTAAWNTVQDTGGGSQPQFLALPPVPIAFDSLGIGTTGFPVADLVAGDIVCGFGVNISVAFNCDNPALSLRMRDNSGRVCVNGGTVGLDIPSSSDADSVTLNEVFDGWTLALQDQPLVAFIADTTNGTTGQGDLYITILRPAS